jgi:competence CoiA-like predicted nuclease
MPFIARNLEGERIDITQIEFPRTVLKSGEVFCQNCGKPLIVKAGHIRRAHFAHYSECDGRYDCHPESEAHLKAKEFLRENLAREFKTYSACQFELEVPIDMEWRERGRIADLLVTFPMGWRVAHEIQLASITVEQLEERTNDYLRAGIDVVWWLGNSAITEANLYWCQSRFGAAFVIHDLS